MSKDFKLDFSDVSGGKNSVFPAHALNDDQCCDTLNLLHERTGISRAPGYLGLAEKGHYFKGLFNYVHDDGTVSVILLYHNSIFVFDPSDNSITHIGYNLNSTIYNNQWYGVNACGNFYLCNGYDFIKIEDDLSVYNVGISTPPFSWEPTSANGGYLDNGTYKLYICYARKDSMGRYLYSYPHYSGEVVVDETPDGTGLVNARWYHSASTNMQETHVVFFMTDADGEIPYFYGEVPVTSSTFPFPLDGSTRNELITMASVASSNVPLPITPSGIFYFDDRLYVWDVGSKNVYYSLQSDVNPFDLERFLPENFRLLPMQVNGIFSIGPDLYFNHIGNGISTAYYGDMSSVIKHVQKQFWFMSTFTEGPKTDVVTTKGIVFGLTNDGFRFFDGATFSDDISFNIKPDVDKVYSNISELPCAITFRRPGKRTEYRFSYENLDYSALGNNSQLIFNLDYYFDPYVSKRCWEVWENGFKNMVVSGSTWYGIQSSTDRSFIVKESGVSDLNCFNRGRQYVSTKFAKKVYLLTRTYMDDLDSICIWGSIYGLATSAGNISGNLIIFDDNNTKYSFSLSGEYVSSAVLPSEASGLGLALPFTMAPQIPINTVVPMSWNCRGNTVAIEIEQEEDDPDFFIYKIQLPRVRKEKNNLT